jgi:hypothetical protein
MLLRQTARAFEALVEELEQEDEVASAERSSCIRRGGRPRRSFHKICAIALDDLAARVL